MARNINQQCQGHGCPLFLACRPDRRNARILDGVFDGAARFIARKIHSHSRASLELRPSISRPDSSKTKRPASIIEDVTPKGAEAVGQATPPSRIGEVEDEELLTTAPACRSSLSRYPCFVKYIIALAIYVDTPARGLSVGPVRREACSVGLHIASQGSERRSCSYSPNFGYVPSNVS